MATLAGDLRTARELLPLISGLKRALPVAVVLGLLSSVIDSCAVSLMVLIVFKGISSDFPLPDAGLIGELASFAEAAAQKSPVVLWGTVIGIALVRALVAGAYSVLSAHLTNSIHHRTRLSLFEKFMALPYQDLARTDYGTMTNALQVESWYVAEVVRSLCGLMIAVCSLVVYLVIVFFISWPLGILAMILGGGLRWLCAGLKQPLRRMGFEATRTNEELALRMYTRMQAIRTIRAHGFEKAEVAQFEGLSREVAGVFTRMALVENYLRPLNDVSILVVMAALCFFSAAMGDSLAITATVIALMYRLQPHLGRIDGALLTLVKSQGPLAAVLKQLRAPDMRDDAMEDLSLHSPWQTLRFEKVSFAYEHEPVLVNLSFELKRGSVLAIRGLSGAGKSTLVSMLLKLLKPASGRITIDAQDFMRVKREQWLSGVAAAGQDFELMDGTLAENLMLGRDIAEEELQTALRLAEIDDFVMKLPEGLQTRVGEKGIRLSGGQRQRIVLARALAAHPDLLILDEAASAVSIDMERKIYGNIRRARPGITLIVVTHRELPEGLADEVFEV
ncbi:ABC transporter ATP-binding protein [Roseimicrobium gellanilyticum]|uniref:ABC transporter ATP-binding protein n=1 Tax=Roseimicrobium gellanilyticum TaxID=748857 RepID=UPI001475DAED|nr:ABC transporter ATP-binding protein [Roseimicrobium gellanilyticum]